VYRKSVKSKSLILFDIVTLLISDLESLLF